MGALIALCILAVWIIAGLVIRVSQGGFFGGSSDPSSEIGSLAALVIIVIILGFTVKEIVKRWPQVMEERRRSKE